MFDSRINNQRTNLHSKMQECAQPLSVWQRYIIVDDDPMNNLVSKFIIQRHSKEAEILLFTDPEVGLDKIYQVSRNSDDQQQTIILLDINMPRMSGWDFLDQFKNLKMNTCNQFRIYMISSSIDPLDKKKAVDHALISGFFTKPLNSDHLKIILSQK